MVMIFYDRSKLQNRDEAIIRIMDAEYFYKPRVRDEVVICGITYVVYSVTINYDEKTIDVIVDEICSFKR